MKKTLLLAIIGLGGLATAQENAKLQQQLEQEKQQLDSQYDLYVKSFMQNQSFSEGNTKKISELEKTLEDKRKRLVGFFQGKPFFLKKQDIDQIKNANVDALQEGTVSGLNGSYNGEGIKVSVFDGGPAYEKHRDFRVSTTDATSRITNKETINNNYDSHATGVTGMIGALGTNVSGNLGDGTRVSSNTKGMMPKATFDNYSFFTSTLSGETSNKTIFQKIEQANPYLSNHSYGVNAGWEYEYASADNAGEGWYWNSGYNATNKTYYSFEGAYYTSDRNYDNLVYASPSMIIVKSAGNSYGDGPAGTTDKKFYSSSAAGNVNGYMEFTDTDTVPPNNCSNGSRCISNGGLAKNIIIVGATRKITTNDSRYTTSTDVVKASYSSAGPRQDGAIKPDIAGVGSLIFHPDTEATGSETFGAGSGTSYSAPQVTGIIGLWYQVYKTLFNGATLDAASAKNLLTHSAQEAGRKGPDVDFGWGFADSKKGAEILVDKANGNAIFEDKTLTNAQSQSIEVESDGSKPLKVSISWIDPSYKTMPQRITDLTDTSYRLINDLDLRVINTTTNEVFYPWKLDIANPTAPAITGDNLVDNIEQVLIETPTAGTYRIEISNKKQLVNNSGANINEQKYSLLVTGYTKKLSTTEAKVNDNEVNLYPTVTKQDLNIKSSANVAEVIIYDTTGKVVKHLKGNVSYVDVSSFNSGVYVVNIITNNGKVSKKFIKQ